MKKIKLLIRQYFDFSQRETNGFLLLSLLILLLILAPFLFQKFYPSKTVNAKEDEKKLDSILASIEIDSVPRYEKRTAFKNYSTEIEPTEITLFEFNPNQISSDEFQKLGVKKYIAERIIKFRQKGGGFRVKNDLKKIYGFDSLLFKKLEQYILLPDKIEKPVFATADAKKEFKVVRFDLNQADSAQFEKVYGIGAKLASRIIKFRSRLGGFVSKNQLKEVYGLDSVLLIELDKKTIILENYLPTKIKVNQTSLDELKSHPYVGYKSAKIILAYKNTHGRILDKNDFANIKAFGKEEIEKIVQYLDFQ